MWQRWPITACYFLSGMYSVKTWEAKLAFRCVGGLPLWRLAVCDSQGSDVAVQRLDYSEIPSQCPPIYREANQWCEPCTIGAAAHPVQCRTARGPEQIWRPCCYTSARLLLFGPCYGGVLGLQQTTYCAHLPAHVSATWWIAARRVWSQSRRIYPAGSPSCKYGFAPIFGTPRLGQRGYHERGTHNHE